MASGEGVTANDPERTKSSPTEFPPSLRVCGLFGHCFDASCKCCILNLKFDFCISPKDIPPPCASAQAGQAPASMWDTRHPGRWSPRTNHEGQSGPMLLSPSITDRPWPHPLANADNGTNLEIIQTVLAGDILFDATNTMDSQNIGSK